MSNSTPLTAPTQYITASNGIRYAYRHLGPPLTQTSPPPLVLHIHYRANMDLWDPLFLATLSALRPVLIFDQPGIGRTLGTIPTTYQGWADDLLQLVDALELKEIDLLGFSMGGLAVQYVALTRPGLVRRLVLAGTTASAPMGRYEDIKGVVKPREMAPGAPIEALSGAVSLEEGKRALAFSFFSDDEDGREAFEGYWGRVAGREVEGEELKLQLLDAELAKRQIAAVVHSQTPGPDGSFDRLHELSMPVLVANGDADLLIPSSRSWELFKHVQNAQLIMYPKSGHGFIWQYAEMFARDVNKFLAAAEWGKLSVSKL